MFQLLKHRALEAFVWEHCAEVAQVLAAGLDEHHWRVVALGVHIALCALDEGVENHEMVFPLLKQWPLEAFGWEHCALVVLVLGPGLAEHDLQVVALGVLSGGWRHLHKPLWPCGTGSSREATDVAANGRRARSMGWVYTVCWAGLRTCIQARGTALRATLARSFLVRDREEALGRTGAQAQQHSFRGRRVVASRGLVLGSFETFAVGIQSEEQWEGAVASKASCR